MPDKRLKLCAEFVKGGRVCDIGTDHAYLVAELLSAGTCSTAIAADINEGPLSAARVTLEKAGVSDRAEVILSDGLAAVPADGITDIVIAGMGGELISRILGACEWLDGKNLILQPMTQAPYLISWLCENGFEIIEQSAVVDGRFCYTVINAVKNGKITDVTPLFEQVGKLDFSDSAAVCYAEKQAERLYAAGRSLRDSGHSRQAVKNIGLAAEIILATGGKPMYTVKDIYAMMDEIAPMKNIHKGDNSGLLVGSGDMEVTKVLVALDVTAAVVQEAIDTGANVIVAHHPVIFHPLYSLNESNPACLALKNNIACICFHSPLDMADGGINDIIFDMLDGALKLKKKSVLEPIHADGRGYGFTCSVGTELYADEFGKCLKDIFGCTVVRYTNSEKKIKTVSFCSGGAGGNLPMAIEQGADAYVTGDVKHDQWITAKNCGIALYDCGHFHTEDIVVQYLVNRLTAAFAGLDVNKAKADIDPVDYIF